MHKLKVFMYLVLGGLAAATLYLISMVLAKEACAATCYYNAPDGTRYYKTTNAKTLGTIAAAKPCTGEAPFAKPLDPCVITAIQACDPGFGGIRLMTNTPGQCLFVTARANPNRVDMYDGTKVRPNGTQYCP